MKLQILYVGLDPNRAGKNILFFNKLGTKTRTMLITSVSLFNELATEKKKLSL
jgi:hypothetical protein